MSEPLARAARALCMLALLLGAPYASAQFILDAVPGGLVEIPLVSIDQGQPQAYFGRRRVLVTKFARRWVGVVGLPLSLVPGTYVIQVGLEGSENLETREFTVYPRHRGGGAVVSLPGPPADAPEPDFEWRESLDAELPLNAPVALPARQTFGRYRRQSGSGQSAPEYADFVAFTIAGSTVVKSPAAGRVAATSVHESGSYVWIDHGMALYTRLGPLTETTLRQSDHVSGGQPVGRVRLDEDEPPRDFYLSVFLNGTAINPFLISDIKKANVVDNPARSSGSGGSR